MYALIFIRRFQVIAGKEGGSILKRIFSILLVLSLLLCLCACADSGEETPEQTTESTTQATEPIVTTEATEPEDDRICYTIKVVDEAGNPIVGAMVQMCQGENCIPASTADNGIAEIKVDEQADFEVKFIMLPAGYDYTTEEQVFHFADGAYELTITLKAVA